MGRYEDCDFPGISKVKAYNYNYNCNCNFNMSTMRAVLVKDGKGPSSSLYISSDVPIPEVADDEVLIKIKAFALNRMDIIQRDGNYPLPPGTSSILGVEFAGLVHKVSSKADCRFNVGERVYGLVAGGCYAEYVVCKEALLLKIPEELSFEEAASIPEVWITATQVVKAVGGLKKGDKFLFHAGASGVGLAAIQIAQGEGATHVFCTVGSDEKKKFIVENMVVSDAEKDILVPINYNTEDFVEVTKSAGLTLIVDPVGKSYFNQNLQALTPEGKLVNMGTMSGGIVESANIGLILSKRLRIEGTTLRARSLEYKLMLLGLFQSDVLPNIVSKQYKHQIDKVFDWQNIVAAHDYLESNMSMGKVVVRVV